MSRIVLTLESPRRVHYYVAGDEAPDTSDPVSPRLLDPGELRQAAAWLGGEAETGHVSCRLDNRDGALTTDFTDPPLRASLSEDGITRVAGTVQRITLGEEVSLTLVVGGASSALIEDVPLRTTAVWERRETVQALPLPFGRCTLTPIRYSADGRFWLVADGTIQRIEEVRKGADLYPPGRWALVNRTDDAGHAVALLEIQDYPLEEGEALSVTLDGLTHPSAGYLLENPADVIWYLLDQVAGIATPAAQLAEFRAECAAAGLTVGLVVTGGSLRGVIGQVCDSVGALWSDALPGVARLYPAALDSAPLWASFTGTVGAGGLLDALAFSADYARTEVFTRLQLDFDYDDAANTFRQSVTVQADSLAREAFGERATTVQARGVRSLRAAEDLAHRLLGYLARPQWEVEFQAQTSDRQPLAALVPGVVVALDAPGCPLTGRQVLWAVRRGLATGVVTLIVRGVTGRAPAITTVQRSSQLPDSRIEPVLYREGDTVIIVARDEQGSVLPGALVSLNGQARQADAEGRAYFPGLAAGVYELQITAGEYELVDPNYEVL